jgi:hypothetical protein
MKTALFFVLATAFGGCANGSGSQPPSTTAAAVDVKTPEGARHLMRLAGRWSGSGSWKTEAGANNVTMTFDCTATAAAWGLRCTWNMPGVLDGKPYVGDGVFGFEEESQVTHWYAVSNAGEVHDHKGTWSGDTLSLAHEQPVKGKPFVESVRFSFVGQELHLVCGVTLDGKKTEELTMNLRRT